jgi:hypothetical protein
MYVGLAIKPGLEIHNSPLYYDHRGRPRVSLLYTWTLQGCLPGWGFLTSNMEISILSQDLVVLNSFLERKREFSFQEGKWIFLNDEKAMWFPPRIHFSHP